MQSTRLDFSMEYTQRRDQILACIWIEAEADGLLRHQIVRRVPSRLRRVQCFDSCNLHAHSSTQHSTQCITNKTSTFIITRTYPPTKKLKNKKSLSHEMPEVSPNPHHQTTQKPTNQLTTSQPDRRSRPRSPLPAQTHPQPHNRLHNHNRRHNRLRQSRHLGLRLPKTHLQPHNHKRRAARKILLRDVRQEPACCYAPGHDGVGQV